MAIKIIPEPDIHITQAEMERLRPEWEASQRMTVRPVSFETWLRQRRSRGATPDALERARSMRLQLKPA